MDNNRMIRIYGTLRNWTVNKDIADFNPTREGCIRVRTSEKDGSGHDDAIALAYQLYDNRFRECDRNLTPWERFQDIINKRVTNIKFVSKAHCHEWADVEAYTEIDGPIAIQYTDEEGNINPENWQNGSDTKPVILLEILAGIKEAITNIKQDIVNIKNDINILKSKKCVKDIVYDADNSNMTIIYSDDSTKLYHINAGSPSPVVTGDCLWEEYNGTEGAGIRPKNSKKVYGPGFYDTEVV